MKNKKLKNVFLILMVATAITSTTSLSFGMIRDQTQNPDSSNANSTNDIVPNQLEATNIVLNKEAMEMLLQIENTLSSMEIWLKNIDTSEKMMQKEFLTVEMISNQIEETLKQKQISTPSPQQKKVLIQTTINTISQLEAAIKQLEKDLKQNTRLLQKINNRLQKRKDWFTQLESANQLIAQLAQRTSSIIAQLEQRERLAKQLQEKLKQEKDRIISLKTDREATD